jgi:hypothetical protein
MNQITANSLDSSIVKLELYTKEGKQLENSVST